LIVLVFERGNIVARGGAIPHGKYESRTDSYVAPAFRYSDIIEHLEENEIEYRDEVFEGLSCPRLGSSIKLRDYQEKALGAWRKANNRGLIVLPTGAGKTVIAIKAIENLCEATLIVVPTLVLADQWRQQLEEEYGTKIGAVGRALEQTGWGTSSASSSSTRSTTSPPRATGG
jgi:superfamily II DNA or RNA helicase